MFNDYIGKVLHEARYQDYIREAEGGWLLRQARAGHSRRLSPSFIRALGSLILALLLIAQIASTQ